jgi:hypothetical protein
MSNGSSNFLQPGFEANIPSRHLPQYDPCWPAVSFPPESPPDDVNINPVRMIRISYPADADHTVAFADELPLTRTYLANQFLMKNAANIIVISLLIGIGSVQAQTPAKTMMHKPGQMKADGMTHDCVVMKDGKMMMLQGEKMMPMTKEMTMTDGTKCLTDGTCLKKDGSKMTMTNGQCMMMDGSMTTMDKMMKGGMMKSGHKMNKAKS